VCESERHEKRSEFAARLHGRHLDELAEPERVARHTAAYGKVPETTEERWLTDESTAVLDEGEAS
jgi:hypothetical protein